MRKYFLLFFAVLLASPIFPCTTAIITGRASKDGRPLLYKHRDTGFLDNKVMLFTDGVYTYMGIVNSEDKTGKEVWGGYNDTGFAIMNSASYNLNREDEEKDNELEGVVMKLALQKCRTLKDFENLLDTLPRPMNLSANFGVIDAQGGTAYYETGDYEYKKFDANETEEGYLIRTNFSYSGNRDRDLGVSRCIVATDLLEEMYNENNLTHISLLQNVSRSLKHGIVDVSLYDKMVEKKGRAYFVPFRDFIPRYSTSSSIVVQGVGGDVSPSLTAMWTILGSPLSAVALPLLITPDGVLPKVVQADDSGKSPLCTWSLAFKKRLFPIEKGEGKDYLDLSQLITENKQGILQRVMEWENEIITHSQKYLEEWNENNELGKNYLDLYDWIDSFVTEKYTKELDQ